MLFKQLFSHPKSHSHLPPNRFLQAEITFTREGNHSNTYSTPLKQFLLRSDSNGTSAKHKYSFLRHQGTQSHPLYSTLSHSLLNFPHPKKLNVKTLISNMAPIWCTLCSKHLLCSRNQYKFNSNQY